MTKAIRILYYASLLTFVVIAVILYAVSLNSTNEYLQSFPYSLFVTSIIVFPYLEVPLIVLCGIGCIKDRGRCWLYSFTAAIALAGLIFAYVCREMPGA